MTKILVTGSTGTIGTQVVKALAVKGGVSVRAAVRTKEKAGLPAGVEPVAFEYEDAASMKNALAGVDALFLLTPFVENPVPLARGAVDAAKAAGVKRIVKLSAFGAELEPGIALGRHHREAEKYIEASGLAWTFLRPNNFMQNLMGYYPPGPDGVIYLPWGDAACSFIDARDVGAVAAVALTESGHAQKAYTLTGPAAVTMHDIARTLGAVSGRKITYVDVPEAAAAKAMTDMGLPAWMVGGMMELHGIDKAGYAAVVNDEVAKITGRAPFTFEAFARDHAEAWRAK